VRMTIGVTVFMVCMAKCLVCVTGEVNKGNSVGGEDERFDKLKSAFDSARANEVRVVDDALGLAGTRWATLETSLVKQRPKDSRGRKPKVMRIIAWAVKAECSHRPPEVFEEAIVAAQWTPNEQNTLYYVRHDFREESKWWVAKTFSDVLPDGQRKGLSIDTKPEEQRIVNFSRNTCFGNNSSDPNVVVLSIVLFEPGMIKLRDELSVGVGADVRNERYQEYMNQVIRGGCVESEGNAKSGSDSATGRQGPK
jgi:hypothetical protein